MLNMIASFRYCHRRCVHNGFGSSASTKAAHKVGEHVRSDLLYQDGLYTTAVPNRLQAIRRADQQKRNIEIFQHFVSQNKSSESVSEESTKAQKFRSWNNREESANVVFIAGVIVKVCRTSPCLLGARLEENQNWPQYFYSMQRTPQRSPSKVNRIISLFSKCYLKRSKNSSIG